MENIVQLAEYRKRRQPAQRAAPETTSAQYVCTRCDSAEFRLSALGMVHCAHCGALMRNLAVVGAANPVPEDPAA